MSNTFWTDNHVADFVQNWLHIQESASFDLIEQFKVSKEKRDWEIWLTEDGVEVPIIEGNNVYYVETFTYKTETMTFTDRVNAAGIRGKFPQFKYFSTRDAAEAYIVDNAPRLSVKDVRDALNEHNHLLANDAQVEKALTDLVKSKMNQ